MPIRRTVGGLAAAIVVLTASVAGPADAAPTARSTISARSTDDTPRAGEVFVVHGRFVTGGSAVAGHTVRLQTYGDGAWSNIAGAKVTTTSRGTYRMRVILSIRGVRDLRVVGIVGGGRRNAFHRFVVQVR